MRNIELAKALGELLIAALLRAYQAGSRATRLAVERRGDVDADALARVAERARQDARAEEDSRRLLLSHLHEIYRFELSRDKFIHEYRRYPLPVLKQAEKQLRSQLHRNDILSLTRYFGAIVRNEMEAYRASKTRRDRFEQRGNAAMIECEKQANLRRSRLADSDLEPAQPLTRGLEKVGASVAIGAPNTAQSVTSNNVIECILTPVSQERGQMALLILVPTKAHGGASAQSNEV